MSLTQVARAIGAAAEPGDDCRSISRVTTDSRDVQPGDLFVAIRGDRFDGTEFIAEALAKGATACVVGNPQSRAAKAAIAPASSERILRVDDSIAALGRLAAHYRAEVLAAETKVIAITGSNGKTTTKAMIDHVLGMSMKGVAAPKSYNNHIGVPSTLLSASEDDAYVVVEIGTNAPGEVASLAEMTSPDIAVITSIGEAHLEGLGDLAAIAEEKASLLDSVRPGGVALVNIDNDVILPQLRQRGSAKISIRTVGQTPEADIRVSDVSSTLAGSTFEVADRGRVALPLPGAHHAVNAAAAVGVGEVFGLRFDAIAAALGGFSPVDGRARIIELDGLTVVDDSYNANPASVLAAIATLVDAAPGRTVLVLGDMLELGAASAALHDRVVRAAFDEGVSLLLAVGESMGRAAEAAVASHAKVSGGAIPTATRVHVCEDAEAAASWLLSDMACSTKGGANVGDTVWVKGSRLMVLDHVVRRLETGWHPTRKKLLRAGHAQRA